MSIMKFLLVYDDVVYVLGCRLRVEVWMKRIGEWKWAEYDNMTVESEHNNYTVHVTGYHGNAGDAFNDDHVETWRSNGMPFTTRDVDNDQYQTANCADIRGGWWFRRCSSSCLNSLVVPGHWYSTPSPNLKTLKVGGSRMMLLCGVGN